MLILRGKYSGAGDVELRIHKIFFLNSDPVPPWYEMFNLFLLQIQNHYFEADFSIKFKDLRRKKFMDFFTGENGEVEKHNVQ